jgi:hypothetical protein
MDISRIASVICEQTNCNPQELLNSYTAHAGIIGFEEFSDYCLTHGITITEEALEEMLANNDKYLFTESEDGWIPTLLSEIDMIISCQDDS